MFKKKKKVVAKAARNLVVEIEPKSTIAEQFRTLRSNIKFSKAEDELRTLLITSALPSEGKSTVSANLACLFASEGKKVLFIDADMRKPTVQYTFRLFNTTGLSNILSKQAALMDVINDKVGIENLHVITSGPVPPNPSELLGSVTFERLLTEAKEHYNIIIFDAPPTLSVTDAQIIANRVDGTILVIDTQYTERKAPEKAMELLRTAEAQLLGAVMNNISTSKNDSYYYNNYYANAYGEEEDKT